MTDSTWWVDDGELDDEQADVVSLPAAGSFLVLGPPGSGKTNLLLLRASYLCDSQLPNVVVLTFTRSLRDFVVRGTANYSFAPEKVQTFMRWQQGLLREHSRTVSDEGTFEQKRLAHAAAVRQLFVDKPALRKHLDCILVDEVQDCLSEEIELFRMAARHLFFAGDHRQQIFGKSAVLENVASELETKTLTKHYRNGEQICRVADVIGKNFGEPPLLPNCNYKEAAAKSSATFESCTDESDIYKRLIARLQQQIKAYPEELIGIACPRNQDVEAVRAALEASTSTSPHLLDEGELHDAFDSKKQIYVCSMHDAKGLEFRALHLPFAENVARLGDTQKRLAFTSVTRAKTALAIYHIRPLPGYLEQARESIAPRRDPPPLSSLFSKGKRK